MTAAILALEDGSVYHGHAIGAVGETSGEVVFNTAITGYQEILTDPSYCRQIVTLTYPHIGNTGANKEDVEATRVHAAGLVVRDLPRVHSNFRASRSLSEYLVAEEVVAIADLDTRRLTRILRDRGAQPGAILVGDDEGRAIELARSFPGMAGLDLAKVVSVERPYEWKETAWQLGHGFGQNENGRLHVVAYDFGVKHNILRLLATRGCRITVVPARTSANDVISLQPDGIFLSNGPGDPAPCEYAIEATRALIDRRLPTFGICLGH